MLKTHFSFPLFQNEEKILVWGLGLIRLLARLFNDSFDFGGVTERKRTRKKDNEKERGIADSLKKKGMEIQAFSLPLTVV